METNEVDLVARIEQLERSQQTNSQLQIENDFLKKQLDRTVDRYQGRAPMDEVTAIQRATEELNKVRYESEGKYIYRVIRIVPDAFNGKDGPRQMAPQIHKSDSLDRRQLVDEFNRRHGTRIQGNHLKIEALNFDYKAEFARVTGKVIEEPKEYDSLPNEQSFDAPTPPPLPTEAMALLQ